MDMSGNYKGLVQDLLPNADITVDRFHVMKLVNEELDRARKAAQKAASSIDNEAEKERTLANLSLRQVCVNQGSE